jgi:CRP-like cAMP-binding protein
LTKKFINDSELRVFGMDENAIANQILRCLPRHEREMIFPKLELVRLKAGQVLLEPGDTLKSAYFCNAGLISILTVFPNCKSVEVGLVGKEGFVGGLLIAGFSTSATRAVVRIEGSVLRLDVDALSSFRRLCPQFQQQLDQSSQIMAMETTQIAACNRLHEVDQRLVRWLLMSAERVGKAPLPMSHELLAQTLGTRRASVTIAAGILQRAGVISCSRSSIQIENRGGLEELACECYRMMRTQKEQWQRESAPPVNE